MTKELIDSMILYRTSYTLCSYVYEVCLTRSKRYHHTKRYIKLSIVACVLFNTIFHILILSISHVPHPVTGWWVINNKTFVRQPYKMIV